MQLDEATLDKYKTQAPELLDAVEQSPESPWIMRKDKQTGYCVKYEDGWCGIHKERGAEFLGDACNFYPRVSRHMGDQALMTAAPSCPEVTRLMLRLDDPFAYTADETDRLPYSIKNYLPDDLSADDAQAIHRAFIEACLEDGITAEHAFARVASVSRSLEMLDKSTWLQAVPFYLKSADVRLSEPKTVPEDPFNLLHALCGLMVASKKKTSERLEQTVACMEERLAVQLDWQNATIQTGKDSLRAFELVSKIWKRNEAHYNDVLKRWLAMQLSVALWPFAGLGEKAADRITIIGVRMATVRLALMCAHAKKADALDEEEIVRIIQSLARFLDHLGDAEFSIKIYSETGWIDEGRMRGILSI